MSCRTTALVVSLVMAAVGLLFGVGATAGDPEAEFKAPVRLKAGDAWMGGDRHYPSPVFHDVNDDGHLDIVVGDLRGNLTTSLRRGEALEFEAEAEVRGPDGEALEFDNW